MEIDKKVPLASLTVGQFQDLQTSLLKRLVKWYVILTLGIPALAVVAMIVFYLFMALKHNA